VFARRACIAVNLSDFQRTWDALGGTDPLWAILTQNARNSMRALLAGLGIGRGAKMAIMGRPSDCS